MNNWQECEYPLCPVTVDNTRGIEDAGSRTLQVRKDTLQREREREREGIVKWKCSFSRLTSPIAALVVVLWMLVPFKWAVQTSSDYLTSSCFSLALLASFLCAGRNPILPLSRASAIHATDRRNGGEWGCPGDGELNTQTAEKYYILTQCKQHSTGHCSDNHFASTLVLFV